MPRFTSEKLYEIRNSIPVRTVIDGMLGIPGKEIEGVYRFVCPQCYESQTAVNPKTNLSRCFRCDRNFNVIDLVMIDRKLPFVQAVMYLDKYLNHYAATRAGANSAGLCHLSRFIG
jgi:hypothetical protein